MSAPDDQIEDGQIEVVALNNTDWVIYDRGEGLATGCGVIGFVIHVAGIYQVSKLASPADPQFFSTLRGSIDAFVDEDAFA